jgi:hypothetical protein
VHPARDERCSSEELIHCQQVISPVLECGDEFGLAGNRRGVDVVHEDERPGFGDKRGRVFAEPVQGIDGPGISGRPTVFCTAAFAAPEAGRV